MDAEGQPMVHRTGPLDRPEEREDDVQQPRDEQRERGHPPDPATPHATASRPARRSARSLRRGGGRRPGWSGGEPVPGREPVARGGRADRWGIPLATVRPTAPAPPSARPSTAAVRPGTARQPEPGLPGPHDLGRAAGVGVEPVADLGDLRLVGMAADQARVARGDQARGLGPGGALWVAAPPRSLTEASARARLTRSMVAIPVTATTIANATTRMPNQTSQRTA